MIPAATSSSGPRFGNRPEIDGAALTTAATPAAIRRVRGGVVEVDLVEHGDVAGLEAAEQGIGSTVDARDAGQPRQLGA